jgi:hypothetical protein
MTFGSQVLFQLGLHLLFVLKNFFPELRQELIFELAGAHLKLLFQVCDFLSHFL